MTGSSALRARKRKCWLQVGLIIVLAIGLAGSGWWWFRLKPELEARRPFIGLWRQELPGYPDPSGRVWDIGLRPDGRVDMRFWNPETGAVTRDVKAQMRWRVVDGRLQQGNYAIQGLNDLGIGPWTVVHHDGPVTWEGPNRFRYLNEKSVRGPTVWVRIGPAEGQ